MLVLFHFESLSIGPLKVAHVWKGLAILILVIVFFRIGRVNFFIYKPLLILSFLQIINIELFNNPLSSLVVFSNTLMLVLIGAYLLRFDAKELNRGLMFFSSFFILSFIPYKLGLISSITTGYKLDNFGGGSGLIGPFQTPHAASSTLAIALLIIVYFIFKKSFRMDFLLFLLMLGLYFLANTYVRTGLAMFLGGLLPIVFYYGKKNINSFIRLGAISSVLLVFISVYALNNETLMNRVSGVSKYNSEESFGQYGSGRGTIYLAGVEIFLEASITEKIIGMGVTEQVVRNHNKFGVKLGSHNAFIDILLSYGLIGLMFFILYLISFLKLIRRTKDDDKMLLKSMFYAFLIMSFFQGYAYVTANIIIFFVIALVYNHQKVVREY